MAGTKLGAAVPLRWSLRAGSAACLGLAAAMRLAIAADHVAEIPLLPGEKWWGGQVVYSPDMPYDAAAKVKRTLHATDRWGSSNQAQPLFVSSHGRFVWNEGAFAYEFAGGVLKLAHAAHKFEIGTAGNTLREAYRETSRRFFAPSGTMPADVLFTVPQYNTWIELGYDQREDRILKYARDLIAAGYPPGVLMIDDNWQEDYGVWEFSGQRFKNPKGMMRELHALGFKVMVWVCPFVSADSATGRELLRDGCLLRDPVDNKETLWAGREVANEAAMIRWWNGTSAVLDFSNPKAREWFRGRLQHLVDDYGVDGFKLDAGDSLFYLPTVPGRPVASFAPRTPEEHCLDFARVGLDFPLNEYRACWRMAGQPLAQRLRDKDHTWEALRELIPGILTQGVVGYAFSCPDMIGGGEARSFSDAAKFEPELVVRSAQVHALMPMMQFSAAPWRVLNAELAGYCLAAGQLHAKFGAAILALARQSAKTGDPIVRPLEWAWPHQGFANIKDQFMLGDEVMVAPVVTKGGRARTVVFPPGRWKGDDGSTVEGPTQREIQVPLGRLPYYQLQERDPLRSNQSS
jgi:alpha-glucosidase (family GH31 glycosyl hydrolase)